MKNLIMMIMIVMMPFITNAQTWTQKGLDIDGTTTNERLGSSVSLSSNGNTMAVASCYPLSGNYGKVTVFSYIGTDWVQKGSVFLGDTTTFGYAISLSSDGNSIAITNSYSYSHKGSVTIYDFDGFDWFQKGSPIIGDSINELSGTNISLNTYNGIYRVLIGSNVAYNTSSVKTGRVRIYEYTSDWTMLDEKYGDFADDKFGSKVCFNEYGNMFAVSAPLSDINGTNSGLVRVYVDSTSNWSQLGNDLFGAANDQYGTSISLTNTIILNRILLSVSSSNTVSVKVYELNTTWFERVSFIGVSGVGFGGNIALTSNNSTNILTLAICSNIGTGNVKIYTAASLGNLASIWWTTIADIDGEDANSNYSSSFSLSLDGKTFTGGAPLNDDGGYTNTGEVKAYTNDLTTSITTNTKLEKEITFNNPTTGSLKIRLGDNYSNVQVRVMNVYGQILSTTTENNTDNINLSINEATGYYFVELTADDSRTIIKVLKM